MILVRSRLMPSYTHSTCTYHHHHCAATQCCCTDRFDGWQCGSTVNRVGGWWQHSVLLVKRGGWRKKLVQWYMWGSVEVGIGSVWKEEIKLKYFKGEWKEELKFCTIFAKLKNIVNLFIKTYDYDKTYDKTFGLISVTSSNALQK